MTLTSKILLTFGGVVAAATVGLQSWGMNKVVEHDRQIGEIQKAVVTKDEALAMERSIKSGQVDLVAQLMENQRVQTECLQRVEVELSKVSMFLQLAFPEKLSPPPATRPSAVPPVKPAMQASQ